MKRGMISLLVGLSMAALAVGGCANKETVKAEEPVAVTAPSQPTTPKVETPKTEAPAVVTETEKPVVEAQKPSETPVVKETPAETAFEIAYFDFDKSELRQDTREVLSKNADIMLKSKTNVKVKIEGHCDERGSAEYNLALGERRAKSALQYLLTLGVPANRLSTISYGKEKPAVQGSNEEAWAKNRRAEFVIIK
ncbi:MAG: peptidoglycan-associated lipoprotein Pal [Desulfuromonadales bacterium]|nr:peptidoglycan-associated lipoprotein Pal [Desulfuromonadales bacterium]